MAKTPMPQGKGPKGNFPGTGSYKNTKLPKASTTSAQKPNGGSPFGVKKK